MQVRGGGDLGHADRLAEPGGDWRPAPHLRPADDGVDLRVAHGVHTPGEWCSAG